MRVKFSEKTVREIAEYVEGRVVGDDSGRVTGLAAIGTAEAGDLAFLDDKKRLAEAGVVGTRAACVLLPEGVELAGPPLIFVREPKLAFARLAAWMRVAKKRPPGVHATAVVAASAVVDAEAHIGARVVVGERVRVGAGSHVLPGAVLGDDVVVGRDCLIHPNAVLYENVVLGDRVVIHAGAVLGAEGFGHVRRGEGYVNFPQLGRVVLGDDVEIGANACIDCGALSDTRVGDGTKLDNLIQVAHNVVIGKHVAMSALTGISGSAHIGDDVVIGGQAGVGDGARVENGAVLAARSGVTPRKTVPPGVWADFPVVPLDEMRKAKVLSRRLPKLFAELRVLAEKVEALEQGSQSG